MAALTKFFFRAPYSAPRTGEIIAWWESRRLAYNAALLAAGVCSLAVVALFDVLPPAPGKAQIPWGGILVYGLLANLCYTLGPIADAIVMKRWGRPYSEVGATLFRYGFAFAVGVTLLPVPFSFLGYLFRLIGSLW